MLLILAGSVSPVHAHKVNMFAVVEGNTVTVEGYFTDGKPAEKAQIQVFSPDGERLVSGSADDDGVFTFDVPQISDLRISLYAGMGHRAEYTLAEAELVGATAAATDTAGAANGQTDDGTGTAAAQGQDMAPAPNGVAAEEVEAMVRKAVSEALHPVVRNLSELKEQRSFSDIVGGIGFIVGLIGIFFYVKARRTLDGGSAAGKSGAGSSG